MKNQNNYCANDWVQLLELLNKVWGLGLVSQIDSFCQLTMDTLLNLSMFN